MREATDGDSRNCEACRCHLHRDRALATASIATRWANSGLRRQIRRRFQHWRSDFTRFCVADFTAHEHTILGFNVPDVAATVRALRDTGLTFNIYPGFNQTNSASGPRLGERTRAWFKDPDGNVLSVTNA